MPNKRMARFDRRIRQPGCLAPGMSGGEARGFPSPSHGGFGFVSFNQYTHRATDCKWIPVPSVLSDGGTGGLWGMDAVFPPSCVPGHFPLAFIPGMLIIP